MALGIVMLALLLTTQNAYAANTSVAVGSNFFGTTASNAWPGDFESTVINVGDTVTWTPVSGTHTVTGCNPNSNWVNCTGPGTNPIGSANPVTAGFASGVFNTAGTFPYLCTFHPNSMRGEVVVLAPLVINVVDGNVGIGTDTPDANLHVQKDTASDPSFLINDDAAGGADFIVTEDGRVGIGTNSPDGTLHVTGTVWDLFHVSGTGHVLPVFESTDGNGVQFRIKSDSTNRRIVALDGSNNQESQIILGDNGTFIFAGPTAIGADIRMTLDSTGLVTQGPVCNPGSCDATFKPDKFTVPSIEEHAAFMWENSYLWGIGPTPEGAPINLTQKTGGILHELEVAHIYIDQLNVRTMELEQQNSELEDRLFEKIDELTLYTIQQQRTVEELEARLKALEAKGSE